MRILHVFKTYFPDSMGGTEQAIYNLCEYMFAHGHRSDVLTVSPTAHPPILAVGNHTVYRGKRLCKFASTDISCGFFRNFLSKRKDYDLLHYHFPWPPMDLAHLLLGGGKKKTIVTYHSDIIKQRRLYQFYRPLQNSFLKQMDAIVATSDRYIETSKVLIHYHNKVHVVSPGIIRSDCDVLDENRFDYWKNRFSGFFFLFVGMLRYYKGLQFLVEAARHVPYPVLIVGEGGEEAKLKKMLADRSCDNVHFLGALSNEDRNALLKLCGCFVMPSHVRSEAFGLAMLEAMHHSKPLISCEIGTGTSFVNRNGETGLVVAPQNVDALVQAMKRIAENPSMAATMGIASEKRLAENFTADIMEKKYLEIYDQILGSSNY